MVERTLAAPIIIRLATRVSKGNADRLRLPSDPIGVPIISGSAVALECPRAPGYWKNHFDVWPAGEGHRIGGTWYDDDELLEILDTSPRGDKGYIMAHQLIAVRLNTCPWALVRTRAASMLSDPLSAFPNIPRAEIWYPHRGG